jgi:hypothetical protein
MESKIGILSYAIKQGKGTYGDSRIARNGGK